MLPLETLPPRRSEWGSSLPPDCFVSRASILPVSVLQGGVVSTSPNPQAGGPPLVGCPRLLIQFIRSYPPYRRLFLYPQPEDAPCRGDRDPLTQVKTYLPTLCQMLVQRMDFHKEVQRKFQYMFMPHHQNAGQNHDIETEIYLSKI